MGWGGPGLLLSGVLFALASEIKKIRKSENRKMEPQKSFGGEKTNKHKQLRGIVPEMGGGQIVYVFPLFLRKKGNT